MSAPALSTLAGHGALRRASELADSPGANAFAVSPELGGLLPWRGLRHGSTVTVSAVRGGGRTSLMWALLARASQAGAWCALVGAEEVSPASALAAGVVLSRLALIGDPGPQWEQVSAALLDGIDIVAIATSGRVTPKQANRLAARARRRGAVLLPFGPAAAGWPSADAALTVEQVRWHGLRRGSGLLRHCELRVASRARGRPVRATVWPYGRPDVLGPDVVEPDETGAAPVIRLQDRKRSKGVMAGGARTRGAVFR